MAAKKSKAAPVKKTAGVNPLVIVAAILLALLVTAGAVYVIWQIPKVLMTDNNRFELKHVAVTSNGYWHNKGEELSQKVSIEAGTNLFNLDLDQIKDEIKALPGIENCEVEISLPDTLKIKITESVPRAVLLRRPVGTPVTHIWVVDENGKSFCRNRSGIPVKSLPKIRDHVPDRTEEQLQTAMRLVMTAMKDYPDIRINFISVGAKDHLSASITYREQINCTALFPLRDDYRPLLNTLQSMILQASADRQMFRKCDLRCNGRPTTE